MTIYNTVSLIKQFFEPVPTIKKQRRAKAASLLSRPNAFAIAPASKARYRDLVGGFWYHY
jgi:hypothetical protein